MASTWLRPARTGTEALLLTLDGLACPGCGAALSSIEKAIRTLQAENDRLVADLGYWNAGPFVASKYRKRFHRPTCKWMGHVSDASLLQFSSHEEAVAGGLKPCGTCCS